MKEAIIICKKLINTFIISIICIFIFSSCTKNTGENEIFRYDVLKGTTSIDPQFSTSDTAAIIIKNTFEGLFKYDADGNIKNELVNDYTISEDKKTYTFNIKNNSTWSNNDYVTAHDFEFAFKRMFNKEALSPYADNYISIKNAQAILNDELSNEALGVKAVNDTTLIIELDFANPYFISLLAANSAMPCNEKFLIEAKGRYGLDLKSIIFNGPFIVNKWDNKSIYIRRNKAYSSNEPTLPIGVNFYIDREEPEKLFLDGKTDCSFIEDTNIPVVKNENGTILSFENTTWMMAFNQNEKIFKNENIRLAFASAIDLEFTKNITNDNFKPEKNIIPQIISTSKGNYRENAGDVSYANYKLKEPLKLLDLGMTELSINKLPKITLLLPKNEIGHVIAQEFQKVWAKKMSVYANIIFLSEKELTDRVYKDDFQIAIVPVTPHNNSPITILSTFSIDNIDNIANFENSEFDELIFNSIHSQSIEQSIKLIKTAEQMLIDKAVVFPIFSSSRYFAMSEGVYDIEVSPFKSNCYFKFAKKIK